MYNGRKKNLSVIMALLFVVTLCMPGCTAVDNTSLLPPVTYDGSVTLQVLIDNDTISRFDCVLYEISKEFEDNYPNVEVEILRLDTYKAQFNSWEELQAEIKSGNGPDIFILNADNHPGRDLDKLLFPDVNKAMREGQFANLSMYYDYDRELDTAGLRQEVMDAGVVDGFRYTLPLTYDFPVMFVNRDELKYLQLDEDIFEEGVVSVMDALVELGDQDLAKSANFFEFRYLFNFFPDLVDYDTGHVTLDREEMITFLESFLAFKQLKGFGFGPYNQDAPDFHGLTSSSIFHTDTWANLNLAMRAGWSLGDVIVETVSAQVTDMDMEVYPLTGLDGQIVAEVRQFGAINYGCDNVGLAYEFLREMLTERMQWLQTDFEYENMWEGGLRNSRHIIQGFPVRTEGAVTTLYDNMKADLEYTMLFDTDEHLRQRLLDLKLKDKDIPVLKDDLGVVRYPTAGIEWEFTTNEIIIPFEQAGYDPSAVDIETAVDTLIAELELYMWAEQPGAY